MAITAEGIGNAVEFKYLVVNDIDRHFGLWVNAVGTQNIPPDTPYPLRDHPSGYYFNVDKGRVLREYQLVYITRGKGLFSSDSTHEVQVSRGRLMMLFPGLWHSYHPLTQTGWTEYYVGFQGPVADTLARNGFLNRERPVLDVGLNDELVSLFANALEVARADRVSCQQHLAGVVLHIIGLVLSISKNKAFEMADVDQKIEQAKIIMRENIFKGIDPEEIAMRLNISYSWFRKVFKDYTGYAPSRYFQELKMHKARHLLLSTKMSVKEVAFMLDYKSTEHFFTLFKKRVGVTPTEYRNQGRRTQQEEKATNFEGED